MRSQQYFCSRVHARYRRYTSV